MHPLPFYPTIQMMRRGCDFYEGEASLPRKRKRRGDAESRSPRQGFIGGSSSSGRWRRICTCSRVAAGRKKGRRGKGKSGEAVYTARAHGYREAMRSHDDNDEVDDDDDRAPPG